jgi:sugar phosphate isomerase/epimerase
MKLGISNLAWNNNKEFENLIPILKENNIKYIEIVLPKHLKWDDNDLTQLNYFVDSVLDNGLNISSTQSIFYNTNILSFYDINFINHILKLSLICKNININRIILGSPSLRIDKDILKLSNIFKEVDKIMIQNNQILLLEPNSKIYNGEFFYTVDEIVNFIKINNFTNISTMIDTHNILLENEDPVIIFDQYKDYIKHIHISETKLGSFIESNNHNKLSDILKEYNYDDLIIYETKPTLNINKDIKLFSKTYNK